MISFHSIISFVVLILATGCFALPILEQQVSNSTKNFSNESSTSIPSTQTTYLPMTSTKSGEIFPMTTPDESKESEEEQSQSPRGFVEMDTTQMISWTTQRIPSSYPKNETDDSITTMDTTARMMTKESSQNETSQRDILRTTFTVPTTTSTSTSTSTYVPSRTTFVPTTTTEKYLGYLQDEKEQKKNSVKFTTKSMSKTSRTTMKTMKLEKNDDSDEDKTERLYIPQAVYDSKSFETETTLTNNRMQYDENKEIVPFIPEESRQTKEKKPKDQVVDKSKKKPLNQGEKSSVTEEKKSDN